MEDHSGVGRSRAGRVCRSVRLVCAQKVRIAAWLLAAVILAADFGGNGFAVFAAQEAVTADDARQQELSEMEQAFLAMLQEYEMYGTLVGSEIAVYQQPSVTAPIVQRLSSGYQVRFLGAAACFNHPRLPCLYQNWGWMRQPLHLLRHSPDPGGLPLPSDGKYIGRMYFSMLRSEFESK